MTFLSLDFQAEIALRITTDTVFAILATKVILFAWYIPRDTVSRDTL